MKIAISDRLIRLVAPLARLLDARCPTLPAAVAIISAAGIGFLDCLSGTEISWSVLYIFPISIATWFLGAWAGYAIALLSIALWLGSDIVIGIQFSSSLVPFWNSVIRLGLYCVFIQMLLFVRTVNEQLESKVIERTAELLRLEREMISVGERERRRIGADLHDGLGQHLAATALAAQMLRRQLQTRSAPEAEKASEIVSLIEQSLAISRDLAKGLQPIEMHGSGLMQALEDLAESAKRMFPISSEFRCDAPVVVADIAVAEQLYRIAQEATTNAVKHGHASSLVISLEAEEDGMSMTITDDGIGFVVSARGQDGMGIRIMSKRASLVGGQLSIVSSPGKGTFVHCHLPIREVQEVD